MSGAEKPATEDRYLVISENREYGYFRLEGRITTQRFENHEWLPYGLKDEDSYDGGLLWSGLRATCQGDQGSQSRAADREPVYGFSCEYHDVYSVDLNKARRMVKTLEQLNRKMDKLTATRGYVKTYGEYCGRIAEALGCKGIAMERSRKSQNVTGQRWDWTSIGDGVNRINQRVYTWQQEIVPQTVEAAS